MARKARFANLRPEYSSRETSAIAIVPVPYDATSTWIKGADRGPDAMLAASTHLELYDIETDSEVYRKGIFTDRPVSGMSSPEKMTAAVRKRVREHLADRRFVVTAGGEHSVSVGAVAAHADVFRNLTVLQLDAHSDLKDKYFGSRYNHGCVMARVLELCPVVQVGIRSMDISEKTLVPRKRVFLAADICAQGDKGPWIGKVVSLLSKNVYVTVDLDVFDPSVVPSTGTPEPGGLNWYQVLSLLKAVAKARNVVGFDVVELCPDPRNRAPDFLAARLIYQMLSYKFAPGR